MYNIDSENRRYEDWHRYGRERGFMDRAADEVRSWFGDDEAERRRHMDQQRDENYRRAGSPGRESSMPEWQRRDYGGSSPRGSHIEERGRYEDPMYSERGRGMSNFGKRGQESRQPWNESYRHESNQQWGRDSEPRFFERDWERQERQPYETSGYRSYNDQSNWRRQRTSGMMNPMSGWDDEGRTNPYDYRGRGPRNYRRPDERIGEEINQFLTLHPELDATDIDVVVEDGIVTLRGRVDSRHCKRMAEDVAEEVYGVREVHNELRVDRNNVRNMQEQPGKQTVLPR